MSGGHSIETDITANNEVDGKNTLLTDGVEMKSDAEDGETKNHEDQPQQLSSDEEVQCGIGSWHPRCLQPLGNIWCFTAALCFMSIFGTANFSYYVAVITQIERCFGLSSQTTGFIKNVDNIGFMLTVVIASHLGRYSNKPRILVISSCLSGIAIFIFAIPHFIYGGPGTSFQTSLATLNTSSTVERRQFEVCDGVDESMGDPSGCSSHNTLRDFNTGAMALFIISELLQGMINSPRPTLSMTYVDDNARQRSPLFIGKYNSLISAWWGFLKTQEKNRFQCIVRKAQRSGFLPHSLKSLDELREELDETFFRSIKYNPHHVLHHLLPSPKNTGHNLRPRSHNFTLHTPVTKQNYLHRMLFLDMY